MRPAQVMWPGSPVPDLLTMIVDHYEDRGESGACLVNYKDWACPALTLYMGHCLRTLARFPDRGDLITYAVITSPGVAAGAWARGYPYNYPRGIYSLVHHLAPGDAAAPLVVFDSDKAEGEHHFVTPEVGLTVVFPASQMAGVLDSGGTSPRISLVTYNIPRKHEIH